MDKAAKRARTRRLNKRNKLKKTLTNQMKQIKNQKTKMEKMTYQRDWRTSHMKKIHLTRFGKKKRVWIDNSVIY